MAHWLMVNPGAEFWELWVPPLNHNSVLAYTRVISARVWYPGYMWQRHLEKNVEHKKDKRMWLTMPKNVELRYLQFPIYELSAHFSSRDNLHCWGKSTVMMMMPVGAFSFNEMACICVKDPWWDNTCKTSKCNCPSSPKFISSLLTTYVVFPCHIIFLY